MNHNASNPSPLTFTPAEPHPPDPHPPDPTPQVSPSETSAALARVQGDLDAQTEQPARVNAHIPTAVLIVLGALPHLEAMRKEIEALPAFDIERFNKLRDMGLALLFLYARTLPSSVSETRLQTLLAEAGPMRDRLLVVADMLVYFGIFDATRVEAIRDGKGYLDLANDLIGLAQLFQAHRAEIEGKVPVKWAEVERAEALGPELVDALGKRRAGTEEAGQPERNAKDCARLFGLFANTYDQARRAVSYLRWTEDDVDTLVPSIYQGRKRAKSAEPDEPAPTPTPSPTPAPSPTPTPVPSPTPEPSPTPDPVPAPTVPGPRPPA